MRTEQRIDLGSQICVAATGLTEVRGSFGRIRDVNGRQKDRAFGHVSAILSSCLFAELSHSDQSRSLVNAGGSRIHGAVW